MFFIGIDLGGTNIATALVNEKGKIIKKDKRHTEATNGFEHVIRNMLKAIYQMVGDVGINNIAGIGLGIPGLVDSERGICRFAINLGWNDVPVVERFEKEFPNVPIFMDNDVRVATLGEKYFGAGRDVDNLILISLGTGVGAGIIINGKIYQGISHNAGEIGHTTIFKDGPYCRCGNRGCLELYVSATGIAKRARDYIQAGHFTIMTDMVGHDLSKITAEVVSNACDKGDRLAIMVMEETAEILGIGIANYINIMNPEMIIIGGGVSLAGDKLFSPLKRVVKQRVMRSVGENVKIVPAELRDESGMLGAAVLAMVGVGIL